MTGLRSLVLLLAVAVFAASCSSDPDTAEPAPTTEAPTAVLADEPTSVPDEPPAVSDDERIAAAVAQFEADLASDDGLEAMVAADILDTRVDNNGNVVLNVCGWTGDTVFDQVRDSLYDIGVDDEGNVTARHLTSPLAVGDCVNSTLVESALEALETFDAHWGAAIQNPASFADDPQRLEIYSETGLTKFERIASGFTADGVQFAESTTGDGFDHLQADLLWRRYEDSDGRGFFEFVSCRAMKPDYGLYRGDLLLDDYKDGTIEGPHFISLLQLTTTENSAFSPRVREVDDEVWGDCFNTGNWFDAVMTWQPEPVAWAVFATGGSS